MPNVNILEALTGSPLPIMQAPMAGVQGSAMAIAVSNAGGLGSLPCAMLGADALSRELAALQAGCGGRVNLNFFAHTQPPAQPEVVAVWRTLFDGYYSELGVDPAAQPGGPARLPFNAEAAAMVATFKPAVVSFHFGLPAPELLAAVRESGAKILATATTVAEALWLERQGVIAQGSEAGGHRGMFLGTDISTQLGTFALLPQVVRALRIPVIATGGIADAAGVRAVLGLGAVAAQVGTAWLLCPEATTSAVHRAALQSPQGRETVLTNVFSGRPARGIVNRLIRELGPMSPLAPAFPLATAASAPLRAQAERQGSGDFSPLWAGQNVTGCREVPAAQLTRELAGLG